MNLYDTLTEANAYGLLAPGSDEAVELAALAVERESAARRARIAARLPHLAREIETAQRAAAPELVRLPAVPGAATDRMLLSSAFMGGTAGTVRGCPHFAERVTTTGKREHLAFPLHSAIAFVDTATWDALEPTLHPSARRDIHVSPKGADLTDPYQLGIDIENRFEGLVGNLTEESMPLIATWYATLADTGRQNDANLLRRWCARTAGLQDPAQVCAGNTTTKPWAPAEQAQAAE